MHILVVDDDPLNTAGLGVMLRLHGHEVVQAMNGEAALSKMSIKKPDLVMADLYMPALDGVELIKRMRGNESVKDVPVIILTAAASEVIGPLKEELEALGHVRVVQKPCDPDDILKHIGEVIVSSVRGEGGSS